MDPVDAFLRDVRRLGGRLLTEEEETEAVRRGDHALLVKSNLRLVVRMAQDARLPVPMEDRLAAGTTALMRAAQRYQLGKGARFATYAHKAIWRALLRTAYNRNYGPVNIAPDTQWVIAHLEKAERAGKVDLDEFAKTLPSYKFKTPKRRSNAVAAAVRARRDWGSQAPLTGDEPSRAPNPSRPAEYAEERDAVHESVTQLPDRLQFVIRHTYGIGAEEWSSKQIADVLGVTRQRVHQLRERAERFLSVMLKEHR